MKWEADAYDRSRFGGIFWIGSTLIIGIGIILQNPVIAGIVCSIYFGVRLYCHFFTKKIIVDLPNKR
jgi:hypothetical protein